MAKRTHFTTVTTLPAGITRETVMSTLHSHTEMIDLNPLVIERHPIRPPPAATPEEAHASWYSITDKISYLPAGLYTGSLNFQACFHDLEDGLQTRVVAPMGLDMRGRWTLGGSLPGEKIKKQELNLGMPKQGLWLREDVDMKVNVIMTPFVKKTTKKAHQTLVDRLIEKSHLAETDNYNSALNEQISLREQYPPDYHSGVLSPDAMTAPSTYEGSSTMTRDSRYSTGTSISGGDAVSLRSQGGSQHDPRRTPSLPAQQPSAYATPPPHHSVPVAAVYPSPLNPHQQQQHQHQQQQHGYPPDHKYVYQPIPQYPAQHPAPCPSSGQNQSQQFGYPYSGNHYPNQPPPPQGHPALNSPAAPAPLRTKHLHPSAPAQQGQGGFAVELPSQGDRTPAELGSA